MIMPAFVRHAIFRELIVLFAANLPIDIQDAVEVLKRGLGGKQQPAGVSYPVNCLTSLAQLRQRSLQDWLLLLLLPRKTQFAWRRSGQN